MEVLNSNDNLFMFIDVQTNGFPLKKGFDEYYNYTDLDKYKSSRIVQLSYVIYNHRKELQKERDFIVKPNDFNIENSYIHNITYDYAINNGINLSDACDILERDLNHVRFVIAHNFKFDINILLSELHRLNRRSLIEKILDKEQYCLGDETTDILKLQFPNSDEDSTNYKMPKLEELYEYCFNRKLPEHNNSLINVKCIADCFFHILGN
jgi:DNA polymerase III epsilon subunit-like protein